MNSILNILLLLSVPVLPLLLAFPALRSHLPWPRHIALLPAILVLAVPTVASIEVPWLLFGTGLGIEGAGRFLLAMSVVLWACAASLVQTPIDPSVDSRFTTLFLLTMAGNLGVILATDLVGFFAFSTLMGYGFYGLLVNDGDTAARQAGRVYLGSLILADLLLFEALLIVAATTADLSFAVVHQAIAQSHAPGLYVLMVLAGFALKAAIWPLHFWLPLTFRSARPAVALLLGGVPVAIALLGIVRWLPPGGSALTDLGGSIQWIGLAAAVYGTIAGLLQSHPRPLLAYAGIVVTSLFVTSLGSGPEWPMAGSAIQGTAHLFIPCLGFTLAALVAGSVLATKVNSRRAPGPLLFAGHAAGALLLALLPVTILLQSTGGNDPLFSDSGIAALWPWWTLCTTLLALRWLYLMSYRQQEAVSFPATITVTVWSILLLAAYVTGLLALVLADKPTSVIVDAGWPTAIGILIGGSAWWMAAKNRLPAIPTVPPGDLYSFMERGFSRVASWVMSMGLQVLPRWRAAGRAVADRLLQVQTRAWRKALYIGEQSLHSWALAVTLLLLTAIVIALWSR